MEKPFSQTRHTKALVVGVVAVGEDVEVVCGIMAGGGGEEIAW